MTTRPRVLLIGWDAADWQMIDPLLRAGQMPALARFLDGGVRANLATLHPIISPILWNSIATGKRADKHGILGFMEPDGKGFVRPVSSTSRRARALWNILGDHAMRSIVVGWYASYPAEPIHGGIVTDRYQRTAPSFQDQFPLDERAVHPASLRETLASLRVGINDIAGEQAEFFVPSIREIDHATDPHPAALAHLLAECATTHNAATYLAEHEPWDFMAVYYDSIDHFGHAFMEYHPPRMEHVSERDFERYRGVMAAAYRFHDLMLARLLHLAGPETTVILLSDHGFQSGPLRPRLFVDPATGRKSGAGMNPVAWHRPYGVLAARGPGILRGATINGATLLDIAPTVLTLLGVPVGDDMDGAPLRHMFESPPEVARVPTHEAPGAEPGTEPSEDDPFAAEEALRQLAALGYLEAPSGDKAETLASVVRDRKSNLAQVHFAAGRPEESAALLRELIAESPTPEFRTRLAMCLISLERFGEVEPLLADLDQDASQAPVAALLTAQLRFGQGRDEEAAALLRRVIEFGVRFPQLHTQLGRVLLRQRRWAEAEAALRRALEIDPDDAEAHDALGTALRGQGRAGDAVYEHMRAIALSHLRAESHVNLGIALADCKSIDWAIRAFETAIELAPDSPFPHRCLFRLYRRGKKDPERARRHLEAAIDLRAKAVQRRRDQYLARTTW